MLACGSGLVVSRLPRISELERCIGGAGGAATLVPGQPSDTKKGTSPK